MANYRITNKILVLKKDAEINRDLKFKKGDEFVVVQDAVYIKGYPVPPDMQSLFLNWILQNPTFFNERLVP